MDKEPKAAFPVYAKDDGMTLRDYFAAKVMASLAMMPAHTGKAIMVTKITADSYMIADAMLKEREKKP